MPNDPLEIKVPQILDHSEYETSHSPDTHMNITESKEKTFSDTVNENDDSLNNDLLRVCESVQKANEFTKLQSHVKQQPTDDGKEQPSDENLEMNAVDDGDGYEIPDMSKIMA